MRSAIRRRDPEQELDSLRALPLRPLAAAFFTRQALDVAREIIGCVLVHDTPDGRTTGLIVEAEAYGGDDPASHAFHGRTPRNAPMFESPARAYVYFTYGMHFCLNVVTDRDGHAGAVLLRAVEPIEGIELMRARRPGVRDRDLARGPGRLTRAFAVTAAHNRADLTQRPLFVCAGERLPWEAIIETPRIGLGTKQDNRRWRFAVKTSPWVSGPARPAKRAPRKAHPARDSRKS